MEHNTGEKDAMSSEHDIHGTPLLVNASGHVQELDRQ